MTTKTSIFERYLKEYLQASKKGKGKILDTICDVTLYQRESAIRKFRTLQMKDASLPHWRGRKRKYGPDVRAALRMIFDTSGGLCGELLHAAIPEYVDVLKQNKDWKHRPEATKLLLEMSERTCKRMVKTFRGVKDGRRGIGSTKPSHIKNIVPVFHGSWKSKPVGYGQIDTVVHCGSRLQGEMIYSVNFKDIQTCWSTRAAQWSKGEIVTCKSIERIEKKLPFPLVGLHPDSGSEFINWNLKGWTDVRKIELTRSRPNHSNDNAHIEQNNGNTVRRFVGYVRLDVPEIVPLMNELYDVLDLYINHFIPTRKCIKKTKTGSKYRRVYDKTKTPYQRALHHKAIDASLKKQLRLEHVQLNPLHLKKQIDTLIKTIYKYQRDYGDSA